MESSHERIVRTTVRGTELLRTEIRNVRTPTETLSCSATGQREQRAPPVDVEVAASMAARRSTQTTVSAQSR